MRIRAAVEHNEMGYLIYAENLPGAFTRGRTREEALDKLPDEVKRYLLWATGAVPEGMTADIRVVQEEKSSLDIHQADSEIIFDSEKTPLSEEEYRKMRDLAFKSARDFRMLYDSIPEPDRTSLPVRQCFYGHVPRTAREMYIHTNQVTGSYLDGLVDIRNLQDIYDNRLAAFRQLEGVSGYLDNKVYEHPYGEPWSLKKALRRFLWHDRIHAKAMYHMARGIWGETIANPFHFDVTFGSGGIIFYKKY